MGYRDYLNENSVVIVGNGINRLSDGSVSWDKILDDLNPSKESLHPSGYSLTEYFEIMQTKFGEGSDIKAKFLSAIANLEGKNAHSELVKHCLNTKTNILTTNFDHAIQKSVKNLKKHDENFSEFEKSTKAKKDDLFVKGKGFSHYYSWNSYYQCSDGSDSGNDIKLWHVNGNFKFKKSVKLAVSEYAKCIEYFNKHYNPLVLSSNFYKNTTWLNEIMNKRIILFGFALSEAEIFMRHVLIIRSKYRADKDKLKDVFLISKYDVRSMCKNDVQKWCDNDRYSNEYARLCYFLTSVGISIDDKYETYAEIYK